MFCGQSSSPSPLLLLHCVVSPHSSQFVESVVQHLNVQIDVVQLEPNETNSKRECANTLFTELCMFPIRDDLLILFVIQELGFHFQETLHFCRDIVSLGNSFATRGLSE